MTLKLTRDFYIPKGAVKVVQKNGDGVVYLYETSGTSSFGVVAFHGNRSQKPDFNYTYRTAEARERKVREFFEDRVRAAEWKQSRRAVVSNHGVDIGDIFVASWGYDQTNVDFYQVVEVVGRASVRVLPIAQEIVDHTGPMAETVTAVKNKFIGDKPTLHRVTNGYISIDSVRTASAWNGKPKYQSHYH